MNVWKKISALTFVLVLALALSVTAFASNVDFNEGTDGVAVASSFNAAAPTPLGKTINLKKDIVVYNATARAADSNKVAAPAFSYTYTVTPATVATGTTVTDSNSNVAPVKAGITTGLTVKGGSGAVGDAGDANSAVGTLAFTNSTYFAADSAASVGATNTNTYDIALDFTNVVFPQPGVYRYAIAETLANSATYAGLYMKDGTVDTVYLDVYVDGTPVDGKRSIYGYVCMSANSSVDGNTTTKVNGFVYSATTTNDGADYYYTYDLTLSKTVTGDTYAQTHGFPFTVIFTGMNDKLAITETCSVTTDTETAGFAPSNTNEWKGVAKVVHGQSITYTGIPCGVDVDIYETNDMSGVTYKVTTTKNTDTPIVNASVNSAATPTSAADHAASGDDLYSSQSTAVKFDTAADTAVATAQTYAVENALVNISPTGVTMRYAPYLLTLCAGMTVLPLTRSYRKREED